jgi:hypothetical protein
MKKQFLVFLAVLLFLVNLASSLENTIPGSDPEALRIVEQMNSAFQRIKDAQADLDLEYDIHLFGCTGVRRVKGKGYYKFPDKIKTTIDQSTYFAEGNRVRKIDPDGKKFYVKLIDALDFSIGFHPGLIAHNFNLSVVEKKKEELVLLGIPKPGILKNARKVYFYIDPDNLTLKGLDVKFSDKRLDGRIVINYKTVNGIIAPVGFQGNSALVLANGILVGMSLKLSGSNLKLNCGLPAKIFDPGF